MSTLNNCTDRSSISGKCFFMDPIVRIKDYDELYGMHGTFMLWLHLLRTLTFYLTLTQHTVPLSPDEIGT